MAISGATASIYRIARVSASDAGAYAVNVTNQAGTARSTTATLTVTSG